MRYPPVRPDYAGTVTTAPYVGDVHRMVDRLAPAQVEALYVILGGMLG